MPTINFADVKGLEPIPVGIYIATIIKAEEGISRKDNPKIDLQWKVDDGGPYDGRIIFDVLTFTEKAMFRVKATLKALGWDKKFKGNVNAEDMLGKTASLVVDIETSTQLDEEGEPYPPRNRVKKVKPIASGRSRGRR